MFSTHFSLKRHTRQNEIAEKRIEYFGTCGSIDRQSCNKIILNFN